MQVRRLAALVTVPVLIAGGMTACGKSSDSGTESDSSAFVASIGIGEPKSILPVNAGESEGGQLAYTLFAGLVGYDKEGKTYNVVADDISSPDSKVWTVKIKSGFTFHNGEAVNADSFINAWNWGAYGPNASDVNSYYSQIEGYDALNPEDAKATPTAKTLTGLKKIDDLSFTITLTSAFADFKTELGYNPFYPLPKVAFAADGSITKEYLEAPIGNGPFKMKGTWKHDVSIEVVRYDGWKGEKPKVAGITYKIYQDLKSHYTDVLANTLDVDKTVDTSALSTAVTDFGDRYQHSPTSTFQFLAFPTYDPAYSKVEVRKAISMAINREEIVKTIFAGTQTAAKSFISPVIPGYRNNTCGKACDYDATAAKQMYQAAGGPSTIQITYNADGGHKESIEATCNQLQANLGVTCQAKPEPKFGDLLKKVKDHTPGVGMFRMAWGMDFPSMYNYLQPIYTTKGSSNYYGYSNKQFDDLVVKGTTAKTPEEAIKIWQQAEDILSTDLPVVPLRYGQNNFVHSTKIKHVDMDLFAHVNIYTLQGA